MAELGTIGQGGVGWPWPEVGPSDDTSLSEHSSRISNTMFRSLHPYFGVLLFPVYPAACVAPSNNDHDVEKPAAEQGFWFLVTLKPF